jgi:type II secretory pathway pseudopilin PulG
MKNYQKIAGITMIELLLAISAISVMAVITYRTINVQRQSEIITDSVKRKNIEEIVQGMDAYQALYGRYPLMSSDSDLAQFLKWPVGGAGEDYVYSFDSTTGDYFVYVDKSVDTGIIKYYSGWTGIRECYEEEDKTTPETCTGDPDGPTSWTCTTHADCASMICYGGALCNTSTGLCYCGLPEE